VTSTFAEFQRPPIAEVVCGLQFHALPLVTADIGDFWQRIRAEYPVAEDHAPFAPHTADAQVLELPPLRRTFFVAANQRALIQLTPGQLLANWRRINDGDEYPRFDATFERLECALAELTAFMASRSRGAIEPTHYELTYINHIHEQSGERFPAAAASYLNFVSWPNLEGQFVAAPVAKGMTMFALPLHDNLGELTVVASYAERLADGRRLIVFQLTARSEARLAYREWFALAHRAIVETFKQLSTSHAHKLWEIRL
jgi:uncharacterized protein (TIGR04255 family)